MTPPRSPLFFSALWGAAAMLACPLASAELASQVTPLASDSDRVYGRFDGDWDLGLGLGVAVSEDTPQGLVRASAHYFSMAGAYVSYGSALSSDASSLAAVGVDVRPVFIPRLSLDYHTGQTWSDLVLDSISIGLGAYFWAGSPDRPRGTRGFESSLGLGFPLLLEAAGPWLECRASTQFPDTGGQYHSSLQVTLTWHAFWVSPIADAAP